MIIKYICHKEGISPITLTVYLDGYKPIDVAWQKKLGCSVVYSFTCLFLRFRKKIKLTQEALDFL